MNIFQTLRKALSLVLGKRKRIDYKRRCERLISFLDFWAAQVRWERRHGISVVRWDAAFLTLASNPDGDCEKPDPRVVFFSRAVITLQAASDALNSPRRANHLDARMRIEAFLEEIAREGEPAGAPVEAAREA